MVVIKKCFEILNTVLGEQEIDCDAYYRPLSFCFFTKVGEKQVVYNTLTGEIAEIDAVENELLHSKAVKPSEVSSEFIKKWYLVPIEHDDIALCDEVVSFAKTFDRCNGIKNYTIFTTTECNARCFYCYEAGCKKITMDAKTAAATAEYIIANTPKDKKINITWFGGEPLCNTDSIDIISEKLLASDIDLSASIVSNGYLFDEVTAKKAVEKWNIKSAQITLDGTDEVYNSVKAYVANDRNAFEIVAENIEGMLRGGIFVSVRVNLSKKNKHDMYRLVDWLSNRYSAYKNIRVHPRVLMRYADNKAEYMINAKDFLDFESYCNRKGLETMLKSLGTGIKVNACMADSSSSVTVLPDGRIGKCEHFTDSEFVGDVFAGISDKKRLSSFKEKANCQEICKGCELYPICIRLYKCPDVGCDICNSDFVAIERMHLSQSINKKFS